MIGLSPGVAHVSYKGGGLCLPARSPYDRQLLAEQVVYCTRTKGLVQVLINDDRWLVHPPTAGPSNGCFECGQRLDTAWHAPALGQSACCSRCALDDRHQRQRRATVTALQSSVG
ncbi:MAG TPA: hypothetical protein VMT89_05620 [Candidatus Acidoferrales bacterium]|nr:hypothetical protein [Candidatus Acidoferrales bacterium]